MLPRLLLSIYSQVQNAKRKTPCELYESVSAPGFSRTVEKTSSMERVLLNRHLYRNPPYTTRYHPMLRQNVTFGLHRVSFHLLKGKTQ